MGRSAFTNETCEGAARADALARGARAERDDPPGLRSRPGRILLGAAGVDYDGAIMVRRPALCVALLLALFGCSRSEPDAAAGAKGTRAAASSGLGTVTRLGSCDRVTAMSVCSEYSGAYLARDEAVLTASCSKLGGIFVYAECPNTSVLGRCTLSTSEVRKFYASGGASFDAARAQKECESSYKGKWAPFGS